MKIQHGPKLREVALGISIAILVVAFSTLSVSLADDTVSEDEQVADSSPAPSSVNVKGDLSFARFVGPVEVVAAWQDLDARSLVDAALTYLHTRSVLRRDSDDIAVADLIGAAALLAAHADAQDELTRLKSAIPDANVELTQRVADAVALADRLPSYAQSDGEDPVLNGFYRDSWAALLAGDAEELKAIAEQSQKLMQYDAAIRKNLAELAVAGLASIAQQQADTQSFALAINKMAGYTRQNAVSGAVDSDSDSTGTRQGPLNFTAITGAWQATAGNYQQVLVFRPDMTFLFIQRNPTFGFEYSRTQGRYRWQPTRDDRGYVTLYSQNGTIGPMFVRIAPGSGSIKVDFAGFSGIYQRTAMPLW